MEWLKTFNELTGIKNPTIIIQKKNMKTIPHNSIISYGNHGVVFFKLPNEPYKESPCPTNTAKQKFNCYANQVQDTLEALPTSSFV